MKIDYEIYSKDFLDPKSTDDDMLFRLREAINSLPLPERKIFVMYCEFGTYSEVAKELHCSVPTISNKIKMIRKKILECS